VGQRSVIDHGIASEAASRPCNTVSTVARSRSCADSQRGWQMSPRRSRNIQPLRYYLYISDTKIDMLFDQIDQSILKRISAEVKVDLKVASLTLREANSPVPTRDAKLRIVERFIELHHNVGTVGEPGQEYFRGQSNMTWGNLTPQGQSRLAWVMSVRRLPPGYYRNFRNYFPAVGFISTDSSGVDAVLLVGSMSHVIGESVSAAYVGSTYPNIMSMLMFLLDRYQSGEAGSVKDKSPGGPAMLGPVWRYLSQASSKNNPFPAQWLDFLAVPLAEYKSEGEDQLHVVLGTPLYVAMARKPDLG